MAAWFTKKENQQLKYEWQKCCDFCKHRGPTGTFCWKNDIEIQTNTPACNDFEFNFWGCPSY